MAEEQQQDSLQSAARSKPVPRASIPVTVSEEPVYWAILSEGDDGLQAWGVLTLLNIQAKKQRRGRFAEPLGSLADRLGITSRKIQRAAEIVENACKLCETEPWIKMIPGAEGGGLVLDVFLEWNPPRGGFRAGAGRPKKEGDNQTTPFDYGLNSESQSSDTELITKMRASVSDSDSVPVAASEPETEALNAQVSEPEGISARQGDSGSGIQVRALSGSASPERQKGLVRWAGATVPMIGEFKRDDGTTGHHGRDDPQSLADRSSIRSLFEEYVWPDDLPDDEGFERLDTGLKFVTLAKKNGAIPMAYLTNLVRKHIDDPVAVFG